MRAFVKLTIFATIICTAKSQLNLNVEGFATQKQIPEPSKVQKGTLEKVSTSGLRNVIKERFAAMMNREMEKNIAKIPHLNSLGRGLIIQNAKFKAIDSVFDKIANFVQGKNDRFTSRHNKDCSSIKCSKFGYPGPIGPNGIAGVKGTKGDTGHNGFKGTMGIKGFKGNKAIKGNKGFMGDYGDDGSKIKGNAGTRGDPIRGIKGHKGLYHTNLKGDPNKGIPGDIGATIICQGTVPFDDSSEEDV